MSFYLWEDPQQPNVRQWHPSFLPENVQELQQGALTYDDRPKAVSQPIAFESFAGGCAIDEAVPGTTAPTFYSYSQGVDASWGQPCISPQAQAISGVSTALVGAYYSATYGIFMWSATAIYKLTSGSLVATAYVPTATPTAMIEYGNGTTTWLYLALGDSTNAVYSTDSFATGTPIGGAGMQASYFAVRGVSSTLPILYSVTQSGAVKTSTNPTTSANWSLVDYIGSTGEHVNASVVANDLVWYLKREGIYTFDGTTVEALAPTALLNRTNNGLSTIVWVNGWIYTAYGNRVLSINPFTQETARLWAPTHPELNGSITALAADLRYLYIFMQNAAGSTYVIKYDILAGGPGHTIAYLSAQTCSTAIVVPAGTGSISTTNDVLMYGTGTTAKYFILPRDGYRPWEDSNCRFDLNGGTLYTQWVDCGTMAFQKWINGLRIVALDASGAQNVIGSYALDGDATSFTAVTTAATNGVTSTSVTTSVTFTRVKLSFALATGDNQHTPRMIGALLDVTPNPPRHRVWMLDLDLTRRTRAGSDPRPVVYKRMLSHLFGGVGKRVTYVDYFGDSFTVKLVNVAMNGIQRVPAGDARGQAKSVVQVTIVEIDENGTTDDPFIWGDTTGAGGTPWSAGYQWHH